MTARVASVALVNTLRPMHALLVEDDPGLSSVLREGLSEQGYDVDVEQDFTSGLARGRRQEFGVIILDVMLPGGSGFDLCRALRKEGIRTPVLMLTARDSVDDRVRGLDAGADDYLPKPFAFKELLARLRAITRRVPKAGDIVRVDDLEVDLGAHKARRAGREIALTAKEFALLEFFLLHLDRVVDRAAITAHVWDENHDPFTNVLEVLVRRLRRKIDDGHDRKLIHTLRGAGYRFGR
jgi:two-component system, OmpR family, copper resistance phosphate regulon response regulator CusR